MSGEIVNRKVPHAEFIRPYGESVSTCNEVRKAARGVPPPARGVPPDEARDARSWSAWFYAHETNTAEAWEIAADAFEERGATLIASIARRLAEECSPRPVTEGRYR